MKISDILREKGRSLSFEFFPPKTEKGDRSLFETIEKLSIFEPAYVSVTYGAGGSTKERTMSVVERIKQDTTHTVMPHLTCIGSGKGEISEIVEYYNTIGIENILALRGDPPMGVTELLRIEDGLDYAKDLIEYVRAYRDFSIAVAVYPEGHRESPTLEMDMLYTKEKVEAGADFLITQMFFDNSFFYGFLERSQKLGIDVPIIPGIMPITDFERIEQLSHMCGASIPPRLDKLIEKYADSAEGAREAGIDYTTKQCKDLIENGVQYFHFYTLNHWEAVTEIITNLSLT